MNRSGRKILTTHVGNLSAAESVHSLEEAVAQVVARQKSIGIDVLNEGEYTKEGDWLAFTDERFGGFTSRPPSGKPMLLQGKDQEEFADFYAWAMRKGVLFYEPEGQTTKPRVYWVCTDPVTYTGAPALTREVQLLKSAAGTHEAFLTSTAPASIEVYRANEHYQNEEDYLYALADALRHEYLAITQAGLILQIDDAWLPALWDRIGIPMGLEAFQKRCRVRVEALNHALRGIPAEQIRYHMCWGSWHGPHAYDLELKHLVDILLSVNAGAYVIEGANARHEHEYALWETVKLPKDKILIPGVVSHSTVLVEHPELVSLRIQRYARLLGRENVIAGTDCGLGARCHPQIAWAKLQALVEGAALATKALGY